MRVRRWLETTGVTLIFLYAYIFLFSPMIRTHANLNDTLNRLRRHVALVRQGSNRWGPALRENPTVDRRNAFLENIQKKALVSGVAIEQIRPSQPVSRVRDGWSYTATPVEMTISGAQPAAVSFLMSLRREPWCRLASVSLAADKTKVDQLRATLQLEQLTKAQSPSSFLARVVHPSDEKSPASITSNIFKVSPDAPQKTTLAVADPQAELANLVLVAVINDGAPEAVVQDKKAQKNYFLRCDDALGDFTVKQIDASRIVLANQEKTYELAM